MDNAKKQQIEAECACVLIAFGRARDLLDAEAAGQLMANDGIWDRDGELLEGPASVREVVASMPPNMVMRHVFTNISIEVTDETHAKGVAYYTSYGSRGAAASATLPLPLDGPTRMGDYICDFIREGDDWRIAYVTAKRVFSK